jgi:hypothetical protein
VTYSRRKLEAAALQIGCIRAALFALENRLVCASDRDPAAVEAIKGLHHSTTALEEALKGPVQQMLRAEMARVEMRH